MLIALTTEQGVALFLAWGEFLRGWALAEQGHEEEGIAEIQQGLILRATGASRMMPGALALLAEAYRRTGQTEKGYAALAEALALADKTEEHYYEAELHRLKGELLLQQSPDNHDQVEVSFHQALSVARRQQAKSLELRAAMSLSRLWQQLGKQQNALDLLAPVYEWFTEGFDTADLQEARALMGK